MTIDLRKEKATICVSFCDNNKANHHFDVERTTTKSVVSQRERRRGGGGNNKTQNVGVLSSLLSQNLNRATTIMKRWRR